jgi:hypothetical protein
MISPKRRLYGSRFRASHGKTVEDTLTVRHCSTLTPEIFEPCWAEFSVPNGMLDVLVPEIGLQ